MMKPATDGNYTITIPIKIWFFMIDWNTLMYFLKVFNIWKSKIAVMSMQIPLLYQERTSSYLGTVI
jgi:hypothetical protein